MIKTTIIGILGYVGEELLKLLISHPNVEIIRVFDKERINTLIKEIYPFVNLDILCHELRVEDLNECDVVFLAVPHGVAMSIVPHIYKKRCRIIDLSADFRLKDKDIYTRWYQTEHLAPELLEFSVYGLPEIYKNEIKKTKLVANPGCYPTSIILSCVPLLKNDMVENLIIIDSKSGYSGGGRELAKKFIENPSFYPYNIGYVHRHIPEIEQEIYFLTMKKPQIIFNPHVLPQERGILSTIYLKLKDKEISNDSIFNIYNEFYKGAIFININAPGEIPRLNNVLFTNRCEIGFHIEKRSGYLIVVSVIDNLLKGASGQAVQNMNIMFSLDERTALPI